MSNNKYLKLRGKDEDIYFYQRRVPIKLVPLLKKKVFSQSLNTSDIKEARRKRDLLDKEFEELLERTHEGKFRYLLDHFSQLGREDRDIQAEAIFDDLWDKYPHLGHPEGKDLPTLNEDEEAKSEAMMVAQGLKEVPAKFKLTLLESKRLNTEFNEYTYKTKNSHDMAARMFLQYLGTDNIQMEDIKKRDVKHFIRWLNKNKNYAPSTVQKKINCLSSIYQYAQTEEEYLEDLANPFQGHRIKVKGTVKSYKPWKIDDLRKVLPLLQRDSDRLAVYIGWYTGARQDEVLSIRPEDIYTDEETGVMVMAVKPDDGLEEHQSAKTEYSRRLVPIHEDLKPLLKDFQGFKVKARAYSKRFGLVKRKVVGSNKQYSYHSLRSNASDAFLRNEVPEAIASRILGHSNRGTTMSYGYYAGDLELKQAEKYVNLIPKL